MCGIHISNEPELKNTKAAIVVEAGKTRGLRMINALPSPQALMLKGSVQQDPRYSLSYRALVTRKSGAGR
jgi:hypothetical protein